VQEVAARYPEATRIHLGQDNLNTHDPSDPSALYETFEPAQALALAQRFEFHCTPKSASWLNSWLNMIEIEFSAVSRQCLNRRIPTLEQMEREVLTLLQERERQGIRINWQFSLKQARTTFERHYDALRPNPDDANLLP